MSFKAPTRAELWQQYAEEFTRVGLNNIADTSIMAALVDAQHAQAVKLQDLWKVFGGTGPAKGEPMNTIDDGLTVHPPRVGYSRYTDAGGCVRYHRITREADMSHEQKEMETRMVLQAVDDEMLACLGDKIPATPEMSKHYHTIVRRVMDRYPFLAWTLDTSDMRSPQLWLHYDTPIQSVEIRGTIMVDENPVVGGDEYYASKQTEPEPPALLLTQSEKWSAEVRAKLKERAAHPSRHNTMAFGYEGDE